MIPRISFEELTERVALKTNQQKNVVEPRAAGMPLIPPRTTPTVNTAMKSGDDPSWYVVLSPRETRGLAGPLSVAQLKQMYKVHEITDRTLVWQEGETTWQQLVHHSFLRSQLIYLPVLPPRVGNYNQELEVFDPIVHVPIEAAKSLTPLTEPSMSKPCKQCGNLASFHCSKLGEQIPDLFRLRAEVGTNEYASEILPGFLWVGGAQAVKHRSILTLGFTLIINCTKNMKNPQPQPPHFRCQYCPLPEAPEDDFEEDEINLIIAQLERCYDWVEIERVSPEKSALSDLPQKEWRGATDDLGRPIKGAAEKLKFRHKLEPGDKKPPSRVLIWSKYGTDRASFVAAAYLMKNYGISVQKAMTIIKTNRAETRMSPAFLQVLLRWEAKYVLGVFLCIDCAEEKKRQFEEAEQSRDVNKPQFADLYEETVSMLENHLPRLLAGNEEVVQLGQASHYLQRIASNAFPSSPWSGLVDLDLSDRRLSDRILALLIQMLGGIEILHRVRVLNLRNNSFSLLAAKALLIAFYPKLNADPDDEYYLLDEPLNPDQPSPQLTVLDLSQNTHLEESTVRYLSFLLKQCHSIMRLNLFGNYMDDYDLSDLLAVLIKPTAVFESVHGGQDDESLRSDTADFLCNQSITDLNIGRNKIGRETVKTLTNIFKTNPVIAVLRLEVCPEIGPRDWKTWCHALRLYNSSLTDLVLLNNKLTVKACEHIASVFSSLETRLEKLRLPMCDLRDLHGAALAKHLGSARFLRLLDLSGNNLGDSGAEAIATILRGQVTAEGVALPPLEELDLNSCGLQPPGCAKIIAALATRQMIRIVDLSNNVIGPTNDELLKYLPDVAVVDLRLHYCQVKSAMASSLFELIAHRSRTHVGDPSNHISLVRGKLLEHLRFLGLAGNEIGDSAAPKLFELLDCNISLEILDLGFNSFTMNSMEYFQFATRVTSESPEEKKVYPLHVNLIGNKCDPYLLEAPGMARSKFNLHFGTNPNLHDPSAEGYAHIESRVRGKFFVQKQMEELYRQTFPAKPFNSLT